MHCFLAIDLHSPPPSDWVLFFGHFHPLVVHLPIGFLLIAGLLEIDRLTHRQRVNSHTITLILFWSAVSATVACLFGYLLSLGGGYENGTLQTHQWQGIGVAVLAWVAWALKSERWQTRLSLAPVFYRSVLGLAVLLLMAAGHQGGNLTHGSDYLTQYTPEPFRLLAGLPSRDSEQAIQPIKDVNQALVYQQIVHPILQARCVQCHNAEKTKADLRLDNPNGIQQGSKEGPVLVAGKANDSDLVKFCLLPLEDDHHMPPKGKTQLTDDQVRLLSWWINQGAPFDKKVADLAITDDIRPTLAALGSGSNAKPVQSMGTNSNAPAAPSPVLTQKVPIPDAKAVEELKKAGLLVMPLSNEQNQLEVSAVNARSFSDAQAPLLTKLAPQIVWLKLSDTQITDAALVQVAQLKNLQKLHLEQTGITDAGLKFLRNLPYLEYLNLYGTAVTDVGLNELTGFKALKAVFLWHTKVTPAGVTALKKALPNLEVNTGLEEGAIAAFSPATTQPLAEKQPK